MTDSATPTEPTAPLAPPSAGKLLPWLARRPYPVLALLCLLLWLPGIASLPAMDRDESRFAQSSRQMLENGNFIDIRFGHVPRYKKPVGIYWLQAATTAIASPFVGLAHIWSYRLASLLGGLLAVGLTVWCARGLAGAEAAFLAGALMACTILLTAEATIATTDAVLLATVLGVQGVVLRVYRAARDDDFPAPSRNLILAGWAAMAAGILVKFPIVPGVAIVTVIGLTAWDRQWRWLAGLLPLRGLLLAALLVLPWLVAIALQSHGAFFQQSLGNDFAAKLEGGQESHGMPPGYFLVLSALTLWPAILFIVPAIVAAIPRHREPAIRFLLVWAAAWWLVVEAVPTKLPHYVLPAYPALAILAALWLTGTRAPVRWEGLLRWVSGLQFLTGALALATAPVLLVHLYGGGAPWWLWAASASGALAALAALALFAWEKRGWSAATALAATLILVPALTAGAAPRLERLWITTRLAALAVSDAQPGDPPPVLAGYTEPSMLFALGADTELADGAGAADRAASRGGLALVEGRERGAFLARLAEREADATPQGVVSGFNYSRGQAVTVTVYRVVRVDRSAAPPL